MKISVEMHHTNEADYHAEVYHNVNSIVSSGNIISITHVNDKGFNTVSFIHFMLNPDIVFIEE